MGRINQELEQFLHLFINQRQDDWDNLLPFTEFQYNNHIHSATQNVPVRGCSYELSIWYSMLIPYLDLTLSYSPIAPPMLAYLRLVLILMFYDVLRCSIRLFVYVNSYHHHR